MNWEIATIKWSQTISQKGLSELQNKVKPHSAQIKEPTEASFGLSTSRTWRLHANYSRTFYT